jgi:hypothetical protein
MSVYIGEVRDFAHGEELARQAGCYHNIAFRVEGYGLIEWPLVFALSAARDDPTGNPGHARKVFAYDKRI